MWGREPETDFQVLWQRPEACIAYGGGALVLLQLTSTRSEWLVESEAATRRAVERHGGRVPLLAVFRVDPRFPLELGFDGNLGDLADSLSRTQKMLSAVAMVLEFDGLLSAAMRLSVQIVASRAKSSLPISAQPSVPQAVRWLGEQRGATPIDLRLVLSGTRQMRALLGLE